VTLPDLRVIVDRYGRQSSRGTGSSARRLAAALPVWQVSFATPDGYLVRAGM